MPVDITETHKRTYTLRLSESELINLAAKAIAQEQRIDLDAANVSVKGHLTCDSSSTGASRYYVKVYITEDFGPSSP